MTCSLTTPNVRKPSQAKPPASLESHAKILTGVQDWPAKRLHQNGGIPGEWQALLVTPNVIEFSLMLSSCTPYVVCLWHFIFCGLQPNTARLKGLSIVCGWKRANPKRRVSWLLIQSEESACRRRLLRSSGAPGTLDSGTCC